MSTTWIVSADAGRARIFAESDPHQPYIEVESMVSDGARLRDIDVNTDRVGSPAGKSVHGSGNATPNSQYQPAQTPEQHDAALFARDVCAFLLKGWNDKRFQHLELVAEPRFLGVLREHLDEQLRPMIDLELNKDYSHYSAHQLQERMHAQKDKS